MSRRYNKLKSHHKFHGFAVAISFPTCLGYLVNDCQSPKFGSPPGTTELGTPQISCPSEQTLIGACEIFRLLRSDSRWITQLGHAKAWIHCVSICAYGRFTTTSCAGHLCIASETGTVSEAPNLFDPSSLQPYKYNEGTGIRLLTLMWDNGYTSSKAVICLDSDLWLLRRAEGFGESE